MTQISPKIIDVDGNRVEIGDEKIPRKTKTYEYKCNNMFGDGDDKIFATTPELKDGGRCPTQLFTNKNTDKFKYVKQITIQK